MRGRRAQGGPLRFLGTVVIGWTGARAVALLTMAAPAIVAPTLVALAPAAPRRAERAVLAQPPRYALARVRAPIGATTPLPPRRATLAPAVLAVAPDAHPTVLTADATRALLLDHAGPGGIGPAGAAWRPARQENWAVPRTARLERASRWSGSVWAFARLADGARPGLATGSQLGGGQAGLRAAYRLNADGPTQFAAAARVSMPFDDAKGAEGALGLDWYPVAGAPFRVSVERRFDLGGRGRNAWSAYAAGGFYKGFARGLVLDGYAQAGVVGANRRDLFADGALRISQPVAAGSGRTLRVGAGAWGAAQPGVSRLDIGPRAALSLPVGRTVVTAAAEGRFRVAGNARPGSGLALTLATDF